MRRALLTLSVALALVLMAAPAHAQLAFGVHGSAISAVEDIDFGSGDPLELAGTFGIGGRLVVSPPAFPVSLVGSADYYFPSCGAGDCSLVTGQAALQLGLPLPVVRPYVLGGMQWRKDEGDTTSGPVVGAGVQLNFVVSIFLEGQLELADPASGLQQATLDALSNPFVIKAGLIF